MKNIPLKFKLVVVASLSPFFLIAQTFKGKADTLLSAYQSLNYFNGTALVAQGGKVIYEQAYGYQDLNTGKLISTKSIFQIGSLTKSFTSAIIMKLAEQKKLSINDTLGMYFPEFKYGGHVTIEQLLTHTGGIYDSFKKPKADLIYSDRPINSSVLTDEIFDHPLNFAPGSSFAYSNSGYNLLGLIIEKVTNMTYEKALRKFIFKPAGMKNSGFNYRRLKSANKTTNYSYWSATKHTVEQPWNATADFSAGALYSTTHDLLKWYLALKSNKVLSAESFEKTTTPFKGGYAYGWFIDSLYKRKIVNHGGNVEGATSYFLMDPQDDICIILLNNITNVKLERIGNSLLALLLNKPYSVPKPKKAIQLDEPSIEKYVGKYEVSADQLLVVSREKEQLFLKINDGEKIKIYPESLKSFFVPGEDIDLTFSSTGDKIKQLKIRTGLLSKVGDKVDSLP